MEKSRYARVIEGEEVRRYNPIDNFFLTGVGRPFESQRG